MAVIPPTPIFTSSKALDGKIKISYQCPNYHSSPGLELQFEIKTSPHHKPSIITTSNQQIIEGLRNGWDYTVKVRAKNKFGESEWSNTTLLRPLQKPSKPMTLHTLSGDSKIRVFWVSLQPINDPKINGKYIIISDPPTMQQTTVKNIKVFRSLNNDTFYRFKVTATNNNFSIDSEWTLPVKPAANKEKKMYEKEKKNIIYKLMRIRRQKLIEKNEQKLVDDFIMKPIKINKLFQLIVGYGTEIEQWIQQIIPMSIYEICYVYYYNHICYVSSMGLSLYNIDTKQQMRCCIKDISDDSYLAISISEDAMKLLEIGSMLIVSGKMVNFRLTKDHKYLISNGETGNKRIDLGDIGLIYCNGTKSDIAEEIKDKDVDKLSFLIHYKHSHNIESLTVTTANEIELILWTHSLKILSYFARSGHNVKIIASFEAAKSH